jgi:hypothetical protein
MKNRIYDFFSIILYIMYIYLLFSKSNWDFKQFKSNLSLQKNDILF